MSADEQMIYRLFNYYVTTVTTLFNCGSLVTNGASYLSSHKKKLGKTAAAQQLRLRKNWSSWFTASSFQKKHDKTIYVGKPLSTHAGVRFNDMRKNEIMSVCVCCG